MVVAPWVKLKTDRGKKACIFACGKKINSDSINYDDMAAFFPDIVFSPDNIEELQNKYLEGTKTSTTKKIDVAKSKDDKPEKIEKRGRPKKYSDITSHELRNELLRTKNGDFLQVIKDKYPDSDIKNDFDYINMVSDTVEYIKNDFFSNNPDLIKKHPSIWFRNLCNSIKKNIPPINGKYNNIFVISELWDLYADLCMLVGINRTIENFQIFTGLNWGDIEKIKQGSSPDYIDLSKKIYNSCRSDIVGGLASSFGSNPNQMFIAKSVYGLTENTVITHVSANEIKKNLDDIPVFNMELLPEK